MVGRLKSLVGFNKGDVPVATFPITTTLTAPTIIHASSPTTQGPILQELMDENIIDNRAAVILHLLVERLRGKESPLHPWLVLLPSEFSTTLFWDDKELEWVRGTSLYKATKLKKEALRGWWQRLEPVAQQLVLSEGVGPEKGTPTWDDFLWAHSIFWSRAIAMPVPRDVVVEVIGDDNEDKDTRTGSTGSSSTKKAQHSTKSRKVIVVEEGIVPGLDFANHATPAKCRWTVSTARRTKNNSNATIQLVCPRGCRMQPGTEITINYGDKSNEELLFLYGFAQEGNPHDVLMVACPLPPPQSWDASLEYRVELLRARGLSPQIFLPMSHLVEAAKPKKARARKRGKRAGDALSADCTDAVAELDLPPGVMETLEVFVMEKKDVEEELLSRQEIHSGSNSRNSRSGAAASRVRKSAAGAHSMSEVESSGLRLALLTTLVRLLELKVRELEGGEEGTGLVEKDESLLSHEGKGSEGGLSVRQRAAVVYRLGQKKLARKYLLYANALLQQEMRHLKDLTD